MELNKKPGIFSNFLFIIMKNKSSLMLFKSTVGLRYPLKLFNGIFLFSLNSKNS